MVEVWVPVVGYEGKYEVSNFGRVRSGASIILKTTVNNRGYEKVKLSLGAIRKTVAVHRLVCIAFHQNPENKPQVNHKDLNQLNNHYKNLEWATAKENTNHAQDNGRMRKRKPYVPPPQWFKQVINIETGEISTTEIISAAIGIKRKELARRLNGERYNETPYRYIGKEDLVKEMVVRLPKKRPIAVFDMDWGLVRRFDDISDASVYTGALRDNIMGFLRGTQSNVKGYKFKLIDKSGEYIEPILFVPKPRKQKQVKIRMAPTESKKIIQFDKATMQPLREFDSIGEVARTFGSCRSTFKKQLNSTGNYKGYLFKYA